MTASLAGSGAPEFLPPAQALTRFMPEGRVLAGTSLRARHEAARYAFVAAGMGFLIAPLTPSEAVPHARIARIPRSAPWLCGVMNLRGTPLPVFDLDVALGTGRHADAAKPFVLVLDKGPAAVGIAIAQMPRAVRPEKHTNVPVALPARLQPFVSGARADAEDVWLEFDHTGLFASLRGDRAAA